MESAGKRRRDSMRCALETGVDSEESLTVLGCSKLLELEGIIKLLRRYDACSGPEIVCCVCGKPYKSKVCFTKHVWEHSVYWDQFDGFKNHERVLSIQAAIILTHMEELSFLLVTGPNIDKRKGGGDAASPSSTTSREAQHGSSSDNESNCSDEYGGCKRRRTAAIPNGLQPIPLQLTAEWRL